MVQGPQPKCMVLAVPDRSKISISNDSFLILAK